MIEAAIESASRKSSPHGRQRHQHDEDHADGGQRQHIFAQPLPDRRAGSVPSGHSGGAHCAPPARVRSGRAASPRGRGLCAGAGGGLAGAALAQLGLHALAVEVGENRGHRRIEVDRNRLADLDRAVERAGQRRVLDDRHSGPARLRLDLFGQQVPALGHHLGRLHGGKVETQGHGIMGGVGQHHGGLRDVGLYPAAAHLALQVANAAANLRTALGLLELVAHVLLAHLQARFPALPLDQVVDGRPAEQQPGRGQQQAVHVGAQQFQPRRREGRNGQLPADALHGKDRQQAGRKQRLGQPRGGAQRKQIFDVRDRVDAVHLEADGPGMEVDAAGLQNSHPQSRHGHNRHYQCRRRENGQRQPAHCNQRGLQLRRLPAAPRRPG